MTTAAYHIGAQRRLSVAVTGEDGQPADPTVMVLAIREPDGALTTKALGDLTNTDTVVGAWHYDFTITKHGRHIYNFDGTAGVIFANEGEFYGLRRGGQ